MDGLAVELGSRVEGVDTSMPGIIQRGESTTKGPIGTKMATDVEPKSLVETDTHEVKMKDYRNGNTHTNGNYELVNGSYADCISISPGQSQRKPSAAIKNLVGQLPPEIEHVTFGYIPFSSLISRLVQETFNDLTDVINDMSEFPVPQSSHNALNDHFLQQFNGADRDASQTNVQKKLRLLNFANNRRAQFIKLLILSRWARQVEAVGKVIDLNFWLTNQRGKYDECCLWMAELKRRLISTRDPNPDIKTALEILSLRKASWLPDLGYILPEPLSSQNLLKILHRINTLLSIRLNLHENIPPLFREFSIASGRATFRIPNAFEVDLSIAEEDPASQLYFIDFRFTFSPAPGELPAGRLREEIEGRANDVLRREGLQGLSVFLHTLVLTHKLSILKNQAYELASGFWSEHLKVEAVHRSIVVQYWTNRTGGKNWIEIGLLRGRETRISYSLTTQRIPRIGLRWFRDGKEVVNVHLNMRLGDLSLADILQQVIALHTSYIFQGIGTKLNEASIYTAGILRLKCNSSSTEPMDASLLVQLTASKAVKIVQEPTSGKFAILPASESNSRAEFELNCLPSPATEGAAQLAYLRSVVSQEEVEISARSMGLEPVRYLNPGQEIMRRLFAKGIQKTRFFKRQGWKSNWILAFTTSLEGDFWWIVELYDREAASEAAIANMASGPRIQAAYKVASIGLQSSAMEASYSALAQMERNAAGMISQYNDTRHLAASRILHQIQLSAPDGAGTRAASLLIRFPSDRAPAMIQSPNGRSVPWANEIVKLGYRGLDSSNTSTVHIASARMQKRVPNIQDLMSTISSVAFHPTSGAFAFQFLTRVGETTIANLTKRLSAIGLLLDFVATIQSQKLVLDAASLTHVEFTYNSAPDRLKAVIHFPTDVPMHVSFTKSNPHMRVVDHLTACLASKGLTTVIAVMRMTLPLLRALSNLETVHTSGGVAVLTRSEQWFQVRYSAPYPKGGFDVRLRQRRDEPVWFIPEPSIKRVEAGDEAAEDELRAMLRMRGDGWRGMTNGGIVADLSGVEDLLARLDEAFSARHMAGVSNPRKRKAEGEAIVEID